VHVINLVLEDIGRMAVFKEIWNPGKATKAVVI
jgi:hypothetical protein